jgi:transcriptional regulator with XRE-family HTH domain
MVRTMCVNRTAMSTPPLAKIAHTASMALAMNPGVWTKWISSGLKKDGKDQYGLAAALGVDRSAISKLISGKRQLKADEIQKAARYLEEPPPARLMPVRYTIGAGQECRLVDGDEAIDYQLISGMWGVEAELAIVSGNSMWPLVGDGSRIIIGTARAPSISDHNHMRAVRLADDRLFIKVMKRTPDPAVWTLESTNAEPIEDVVVLAVAPILRIEPQ